MADETTWTFTGYEVTRQELQYLLDAENKDIKFRVSCYIPPTTNINIPAGENVDLTKFVYNVQGFWGDMGFKGVKLCSVIEALKRHHATNVNWYIENDEVGTAAVCQLNNVLTAVALNVPLYTVKYGASADAGITLNSVSRTSVASTEICPALTVKNVDAEPDLQSDSAGIFGALSGKPPGLYSGINFFHD